MQLGIVVVYQASMEDAELLNIHLNQIDRCTDVPYTIYAAANRSIPEIRAMLADRPRVRICHCPSTDLRGMEEHSFYLEELVKAAVEDGVTHIAILHMDSFPVLPGWVHYLADRITDTCVFVSIQPITTCILFFQREFYVRIRPSFLLSPKELGSSLFKAYSDKCHPWLHSGYGYGYRAFTEGLSWHTLATTATTKENRFGQVFGDLVFHLGRATYRGRERPAPPLSDGIMRTLVNLYRITSRWSKVIVPTKLWYHIPWPAQNLRASLDSFLEKGEYERVKAEMDLVKKRLYQDPEKYFQELRGRKDPL
jgi:hypothetical protein